MFVVIVTLPPWARAVEAAKTGRTTLVKCIVSEWNYQKMVDRRNYKKAVPNLYQFSALRELGFASKASFNCENHSKSHPCVAATFPKEIGQAPES